jgi:hypothetical protein
MEVNGQLREPCHFVLGKEPVTFKEEVEWAAQPVWKIWRR